MHYIKFAPIDFDFASLSKTFLFGVGLTAFDLLSPAINFGPNSSQNREMRIKHRAAPVEPHRIRTVRTGIVNFLSNSFKGSLLNEEIDLINSIPELSYLQISGCKSLFKVLYIRGGFWRIAGWSRVQGTFESGTANYYARSMISTPSIGGELWVGFPITYRTDLACSHRATYHTVNFYEDSTTQTQLMEKGFTSHQPTVQTQVWVVVVFIFFFFLFF